MWLTSSLDWWNRLEEQRQQQQQQQLVFEKLPSSRSLQNATSTATEADDKNEPFLMLVTVCQPFGSNGFVILVHLFPFL
jgi:hypothetical protein